MKKIQDYNTTETKEWINYICANREEFEKNLKLAEPVDFVNALIKIAMYLSGR